MRWLSGAELAGFIKEQQAKQVRALTQQWHTPPCLAIIQTKDDPAINTYVRLKRAYGQDIGIEVQSYSVAQAKVPELVSKLNNDTKVHGVILQLPVTDPSKTDELCALVTANKDVDALGRDPIYDAATPTAILWLLAGYNIDLPGKQVVIIGRGKLVGAPLQAMLQQSGIEAVTVHRQTENFDQIVRAADVIITAAGSPGLVTPELVKKDAVVVDAGTAGEEGRVVGDVADSLYERDDLTITPQKGGVGPLTVCALFHNVILAAQKASHDQ